MTASRAYIALGSNLGDRAAHLAFARASIAAAEGLELLAATQVEETAPLEGRDQPAYLNQMVAVRSRLQPGELLRAVHAIEAARGRERRERWASRTLDLDIVTIDGVVEESPPLTVPHPGIQSRDFWRRGLRELRYLLMADDPTLAPPVELPPWAVASPARRAHIARVVALLDSWADALDLDPAARQAWRDAGRLHDALRDADEATLRVATGDTDSHARILHGPAAALRLRAEGESREDVLDAVRGHTVGSATWKQPGQALFMADYLEPGRAFDKPERAALAARVPDDFDGVYRRVVALRVARAAERGRGLHPATAAMAERWR